MRSWKLLACLTIVGGLLFAATPKSRAQVSVGINIGPAPVCPYGYFDYAPYNCAPYGYYGPNWFVGGVFIGAGPWFHGPHGFHGHVNNHFDPRHGYHGRLPARGQHDNFHGYGHGHGQATFHGNEMRAGEGHGNHGGGGHPH